MGYRLVRKASVLGDGVRANHGQVISDAEWQQLDAERKAYFDKIVDEKKKKIAEKLKNSPVQPIPVEPPGDPVPVEETE